MLLRKVIYSISRSLQYHKYGISPFLCSFQLSTTFFNAPSPKAWTIFLKNFDTVLIPEINNGQLIKIIRDVYMVDAKGYNKIMGVPITKTELVMKLEEMLKS
jgi:hypothetical protein